MMLQACFRQSIISSSRRSGVISRYISRKAARRTAKDIAPTLSNDTESKVKEIITAKTTRITSSSKPSSDVAIPAWTGTARPASNNPASKPSSTGDTPQKASETSSLQAGAQKQLRGILSQFDNISIYNAGKAYTVMVGLSRLASLAAAGYGFIILGPAVHSNPLAAWYWYPAVMLGSFIPPLAAVLVATPFVSTLRLKLPQGTPRTVNGVLGFAKRIPPETVLVVQSMRWVPWPMNSAHRFDQLRRLPTKGTNLAIRPVDQKSQEAERSLNRYSVGAWIVRRLYARYWINRNQIKDKSTAPGVLDIIWEQIPYLEKEQAASVDSKTARRIPSTQPPSTHQPLHAPRPVKKDLRR